PVELTPRESARPAEDVVDELIEVALELRLVNGCRVAPRERPQRLWQLLGARDARTPDQHRDHPRAARERRRDFAPDVIVGLVEASTALVGDREPPRADHGEHDVARCTTLVE